MLTEKKKENKQKKNLASVVYVANFYAVLCSNS